MNKILCNVTKVCTSFRDRNMMTIECFVDLPDGGSLSVFNLVCDRYDSEKKHRVGTAYGGEFIRQCLHFFYVDDLSAVKNYKCYLLSDKDQIWSASDVIGLENLPFDEYKHHLERIIKQQIYEDFCKVE